MVIKIKIEHDENLKIQFLTKVFILGIKRKYIICRFFKNAQLFLLVICNWSYGLAVNALLRLKGSVTTGRERLYREHIPV